ncbi:MFS transporter [Naasia sp. SYSU D00948]|uniref:MFS transporter n=1 Tax=Naasia sp. SYSU D00948 TaxID=2817379 RepID=UPI001B311E25|nr:MFS transporter [Naasia sp. SYSU D00948]
MSVPAAPARDRLVLWGSGVFAVFVVSGIGLASWLARIPAIRDGLDVSTAQMGFLLVGGAGGAMAGLLVAGQLVHMLGSRRTILWGLTVAAIGIALVGIGTDVLHSYAVAFAGFFLFGSTSAAADVAQNVEGGSAERAIGRSMLPLFHAGFSLGSVAGAGVSALVVYAGVPVWSHLAVVAAVVVVAVAIATRPLLGDRLAPGGDSGESRRPALSERMKVWRDPATLLLGLVALGMAFAEGSANDWLALAMVDERGQSAATGALLLGLFTAAMTAGRVAGGPVVDRLGRVLVLRASAATALAGLLLVIFVEQPVVLVLGIVLWGLGSALGFPVAVSAASDNAETAASRVSAVSVIAYSAFLIGPPLLGVLGENVGLLRALLVVAALIVVAGIVAPAAREPGRR